MFENVLEVNASKIKVIYWMIVSIKLKQFSN